jgi:hypothetical protein
VNQNSVHASPFRIDYTLSGGQKPSEVQFALAGNATTQYLENFLLDQFASTFGVMIESFNGTLIKTGTNPTSIDYDVSVKFSPSSQFIPSPQDLDVLIQLAFQPPAVSAFLDKLHALAPDSPFVTTQQVSYTPLDTSAPSKSLDRGNGISPATIGLMSASAVIAVTAIVALAAIQCTSRCGKKRKSASIIQNKSEVMPIMPSYSYADSGRNLMQFRDDSTTSRSTPAYDTSSVASAASIPSG